MELGLGLSIRFLHPWTVHVLVHRCSLPSRLFLLSLAGVGRWRGRANVLWCPSHLWDETRVTGEMQSVCPVPSLPGLRWGFGCWRRLLGHQWDQEHDTVPEEGTRCSGKVSLRWCVFAGRVCCQDEKGSRGISMCKTDRREHIMFRDLEVVLGVPGLPIQCRGRGRLG